VARKLVLLHGAVADGSLYVGIAQDLEERVKRHNWRVGPGFTEQRRPVELVWIERCGDSVAARRREKQVKGSSREKKFELVRKWVGIGSGSEGARDG
jgi:predicted GIY-YIG superfamily endonuclease